MEGERGSHVPGCASCTRLHRGPSPPPPAPNPSHRPLPVCCCAHPLPLSSWCPPNADLDHHNRELRDSLVDWLNWLHKDMGFEGWRFDFVRGYASEYCRE